MSLLAIGFMASTAYLANTARRIAADISARARSIAYGQIEARRYQARIREKQFLESAIDATTATLGNTEHFLAKQLKRAKLAEHRLQELQVSNVHVDAAARKAKQLRIQLKRKEEELERNCRTTEVDETLLSELRAQVATRQQSLASFERELNDARQQLETAERQASGAIESAAVEKERLELVLKQKEAQLAEEVNARDLYMNRIGEEEERLQNTGVAVDRTLSDIETRRKIIDSVAKEAAMAGKIASQEKLALETTIVQELRPDDIEDSLHRIGEKRKLLRERIQSSLKSEAQQAALCTNLRKEIQARERALQEQLAKLDTIRVGAQIPSPPSQSETVPDVKESQQSKVSRKDANRTNLYDISESAVNDNNVHSTPLSAKNSTKTSVTPLDTGSKDDAVPVKRRRGRPRKTDADRSRELVAQSSNRRRGRPRKKPVDVDVSKGTSPPKKRGRPRKTSTAVTKSTAVKDSSS